MAAIAYHLPLGDNSLGRQPLVSCFLRGILRVKACYTFESFCLGFGRGSRGVVPGTLLGYCLCFGEVSHSQDGFRFCYYFPDQGRRQQALLVASSCIEFVSIRVKTTLPSDIAHSVVLQAFYPPPFLSVDQEKLNLLCPMRALKCYVHRSAQGRNTDQLLVCFGSPGEVPLLPSRK